MKISFILFMNLKSSKVSKVFNFFFNLLNLLKFLIWGLIFSKNQGGVSKFTIHYFFFSERFFIKTYSLFPSCLEASLELSGLVFSALPGKSLLALGVNSLSGLILLSLLGGVDGFPSVTSLFCK